MEDLMHLDLYGLLDIEPTSTTSQIKTAYRKKALSCHPDKNPDNPRAGELFHQLSQVLEILTDESARQAYDKVLLAKAQAKERSKKLDAKRKKFKDDLEAREERFKNGRTSSGKSEEQKLKEEIERLEKMGSKLVEEEVNLINDQIRQQLRKDRTGGPTDEGLTGKVKIRWRADKDDVDNGGYSQEVLIRIMSKYGDVSGVVMSGKKGRALVEFTERSAGEMAVMVERGLAGNPLKLEGLWEGEGRTNKTEGLTKTEGPNSRVFPSSGERFGQGRTPTTFPSFSSAPDIFAGGTDQNFESIVLGNLRRAEERKKLIQEMMEEDEKS